MSSVFCPPPDYISKFLFQLIKVLTIPDFLLSQPLWLQSPLACLYLSAELEDPWVNQSQNATFFFLTASLNIKFLGCCPKRHQQPSSHSLKQSFSAVEALNRFHSDSMSPASLGMKQYFLQRWKLKIFWTIFCQMFPFPSYYLFEFIMANPWWEQMSNTEHSSGSNQVGRSSQSLLSVITNIVVKSTQQCIQCPQAKLRESKWAKYSELWFGAKIQSHSSGSFPTFHVLKSSFCLQGPSLPLLFIVHHFGLSISLKVVNPQGG